MENADKNNKITFKKIFCCNYGVKEKQIDPKKLSCFIEEIMDPYGKKNPEVVTEDFKENYLFKNLCNDVKETKEILQKNMILNTDNSYNTNHEKPYFTLSKIPNIIKLFEKENKLNFTSNNEINEIYDIEEIKSKHSDSSNSLMDLDVVSFTQE